MLRYWHWRSSQRHSGEDGDIGTAAGKEGVIQSDNQVNMRRVRNSLPVTFM